MKQNAMFNIADHARLVTIKKLVLKEKKRDLPSVATTT